MIKNFSCLKAIFQTYSLSLWLKFFHTPLENVGPFISATAVLPKHQMKKIPIFISPIIFSSVLLLAGCSKVEYDYKALGFESKTEMEQAFGKGYHTKQKFIEMTDEKKLSLPRTALSNNEELMDAGVTNSAFLNNEHEQADASCDSIKKCIGVMLRAAARENIGEVLKAMKRLDDVPKPNRGDRKLARSLNAEGLEAIKSKDFSAAIQAFIKAREADRLDVEVVENIAFTLNKIEKFADAEVVAEEGLFLNPKRANSWMILAIAKQGQGKSAEALQAMWLVWQFAKDKEHLIEFFDKNIKDEEINQKIRNLYAASKDWLVDRNKPNF